MLLTRSLLLHQSRSNSIAKQNIKDSSATTYFVLGWLCLFEIIDVCCTVLYILDWGALQILDIDDYLVTSARHKRKYGLISRNKFQTTTNVAKTQMRPLNGRTGNARKGWFEELLPVVDGLPAIKHSKSKQTLLNPNPDHLEGVCFPSEACCFHFPALCAVPLVGLTTQTQNAAFLELKGRGLRLRALQGVMQLLLQLPATALWGASAVRVSTEIRLLIVTMKEWEGVDVEESLKDL